MHASKHTAIVDSQAVTVAGDCSPATVTACESTAIELSHKQYFDVLSDFPIHSARLATGVAKLNASQSAP